MKQLARILKHADWVLLILLLVVTNQAVISVKLIGLVAVFALRPNLSLGIFKGRLPAFYWLIIVLAVLNQLLHVRDYHTAYLVEFATCCATWIVGLLCIHQLKLAVEKDASRVHASLQVFTVINFCCTALQAIQAAIICRKLNPFSGLPFPYGMSTGDKMTGIFLEASYCNMMVSAMLVIYFLYKAQYRFMLLAAISMLAVFGNAGAIAFAFVIFLCIVTGFFIQKLSFLKRFCGVALPAGSWKGLTLLLLVTGIFYGIISPENGAYLSAKGIDKLRKMERQEAQVKSDDKENPVAQWDYKHYEHPATPTTPAEWASRVAVTKSFCDSLAGKQLSYIETRKYLKTSAATMLLGAGPGRFSSLMAEKFSGLDTGRIFRKILPQYATPLFVENHRLITITRMNGSDAGLSNANWPQSFYNLLAGEYGLAGCALFVLFYIGYFVRRARRSTYSIWLAMLMIPFAALSYLFEHYCVIIFLELLLLLDVPSSSEMQAA